MGDAAGDERAGQLLEVYLAKYASLRSEVFHRFQYQQQTVNFLLVALAAVAAAGASLGVERPELAVKLALFVPLVAGPLGYLYLANELMIFGITGYIRRELSADVSRVLGRPVSLGDDRFDYLRETSRLLHRLLPLGRWLLFLLPTAGPVIYAALFTDVWRTPPFAVVWAADVVVSAVLIVAVVSTTREEARWRQVDGDEAPAD
jgi:hypothetical protein